MPKMTITKQEEQLAKEIFLFLERKEKTSSSQINKARSSNPFNHLLYRTILTQKK
jgi:hypothetical protein